MTKVSIVVSLICTLSASTTFAADIIRGEAVNVEREASIAKSEGEKQASINRAEGQAAAIIAIANASAEALRKTAAAIQSPGGEEAVNLKVAEQYVAAFSQLAKTNNSIIVPANLSDMSTLIASALQVVKAQGK